MASVSSFGLFWRRDQVIWTRDHVEDEDELEGRFKFVMLGKIGENRPKLRICDFRRQQGIYILYNEYGPVYVGLAGRRKSGEALGQRLKEHLTDDHAETWTRFSWFGFDEVIDDADQYCRVDTGSSSSIVDQTPVSSTIRDTEALLMNVLMPMNNQESITKFKRAKRWGQIPRYEFGDHLGI